MTVSDENPPAGVSVSTYEDELASHGVLMYRFVGCSMMPLLRQGRDLVVVEPRPAGRLAKYDVVLYKRGRSYILHRIVEVRSKGYVICGDNCIKREYDVEDGQILGIMTSLVRKGHQVSVDSPSYLRYSRVWCALYPVRVPAMKLRQVMARAIRKAGTLWRR